MKNGVELKARGLEVAGICILCPFMDNCYEY